MAWIKVGVGLDTRREVVLLASRLERDRDGMVGLLVRFWSWADGETADGKLPGMTLELIDSIVGCTGFAAALLESDIGWLTRDNGCLELPKYDKHHSRAAKTRAMDAAKKSRQRRDTGGTETGLDQTRPEKTLNTSGSEGELSGDDDLAGLERGDRLDTLLKTAGIRQPARGRLVEAEGLTPEIVLEVCRDVEADDQVRSTAKVLLYRLCEQFGVPVGKQSLKPEREEFREHMARLDALRAQARNAT